MINNIPAVPPAATPDLKPTDRAPSGDGIQFLDTFRDAIGEVERLQAEAQTQVGKLVEGNGEDIHRTMVAVEKADLAFQLMLQVRNKIVQAYQEISRMPF